MATHPPISRKGRQFRALNCNIALADLSIYKKYLKSIWVASQSRDIFRLRQTLFYQGQSNSFGIIQKHNPHHQDFFVSHHSMPILKQLLVDLHRVDQPVRISEGGGVVGNVVVARISKAGARAIFPDAVRSGPGPAESGIEY